MFFVALETSKRTNIGTILRCAVAFNCEAILIIGDKDYGTHGAHGAQTRVKVIHFYTWTDFNQFSIENNFYVYGIVNSINDSSADPSLCSEIGVTTIFDKDKTVVFVVGNKFGELSSSQKEICHEFIVVPFFGGNKFSRHIMIDTKLSICLHYYAAGIGMVENSFVGEKYLLSEPQHSSERFESKSSIINHEYNNTNINNDDNINDNSKNNSEYYIGGDVNTCTYLGEFNMFFKNRENDY